MRFEIPMERTRRQHVLTILVEDYFQVGAFEKLIRYQNWENFEARYEQNTMKVIELLERFDSKGTFFVLGWIAERNPSLVKRISGLGHEVASRGYYHRNIHNLSPEELREDLRRTNSVLEAATGKKVIGYRSAEKLSYAKDEWILNILAEEGFEYDASFVPKRGDSKQYRFAHKRRCGDKDLWLFPYSTLNLGAVLLPISGGNYLRQLPFTLMRFAVDGWSRKTDQPFMFYFHVWELDPDQPRISAATRVNQIRHYRKLDKMGWIIEELSQRFDFTSIAELIGAEDKAVIQRRNPVQAAVYDSIIPKYRVQSTPTSIPITIVVPCYNEQEALPYLVNILPSVENRLLENNYKANFVFVDDCSTDSTKKDLDRYFRDKANVLITSHKTNQGVAAGIMTGIRTAETEIVCSMDCDCTYDPHELVNMLGRLTPGIDMVTASPYHRDGGVRNVPRWRLMLSRGASFLYRRVLRSKMQTYTSCFRVYRKSSMTEIGLKETGFLGVAEMLGRLDLKGGSIIEHPTVLEVRLFGVSKMKTARTVIGHLKMLFWLARSRIFGNQDAIGTTNSKNPEYSPSKGN